MEGIMRRLGALLAALVAGAAGAAAEPARIGIMLPLSGGSSIAGQEVLSGVKLALEEANAKGGLFGAPIQVFTEDDEASPTKATTAVRKLIEGDKVCAIVGTYVSGVALAAMKISRDYKVPMSSGGSTAVMVTDANEPGNPWFFRAFPGSDVQGRQSAVDTVEVLKKKKVAIIHDNSNYGTSLADVFKQIVLGAKGEVVAVDTYNTGEQDFSPILTKLRALRPEAVYIGGLVGEGATIVRQAAEVGLRTQFIGSGSMMTDKFIELTGPAAEGFAVSSMFEPDTPNPVGKAFAERYKAKYGINANVHSALGYDSMSITIEATRRAGKCEGPAIRDTLATRMADFPLVQGPPGTTAKYDAKGGVDFLIGLAVVKNGKRSLVTY
ncbi:MAG: branched-chain amino acid ABC transporter substrate-binding protein [Alphaproteobacteria bacterium]|nr:branched-chain amino acid ABC transporter substrate-binding protein [Alphaproteobacteria bacterium]